MTNHYTATFKGGKVITRSSPKEYKTAWAIVGPQGEIHRTGFSSSLTPSGEFPNRWDRMTRKWVRIPGWKLEIVKVRKVK